MIGLKNIGPKEWSELGVHKDVLSALISLPYLPTTPLFNFQHPIYPNSTRTKAAYAAKVMRTINLVLGIIIAMWLISYPCLQAQDTTKIDIDHASGIMKVNGDTVDADTVWAPASDVLTINVIKTNTALYDYNLAGERVDVKAIPSLQEFTQTLGPYFVDIPSVLSKSGKSPRACY